MNANDYRISQTQRNEIFEFAVGLGLDLTMFDWQRAQNYYKDAIDRVVHPPTGAFLQLNHGTGSEGSYFAFDYWPRTVELDPVRDSDWKALRSRFTAWLQAVKVESDAPDLWQLARQERAWLGSTEADFTQNTPFSISERDQIAAHLRTIEEYTVKTYALQAEQAAYVRKQLGYLAEAATRVGRFDFKNITVSTFVNIVVTLGLDVEKTQKLLALATQLLGPLVVGAAKLLSQ